MFHAQLVSIRSTLQKEIGVLLTLQFMSLLLFSPPSLLRPSLLLSILSISYPWKENGRGGLISTNTIGVNINKDCGSLAVPVQSTWHRRNILPPSAHLNLIPSHLVPSRLMLKIRFSAEAETMSSDITDQLNLYRQQVSIDDCLSHSSSILVHQYP